jgi:hypothetical protein
MTFLLVRDVAAEWLPVWLTCGVLGFSPQAFYKWKGRPCSNCDWADAPSAAVVPHVPPVRLVCRGSNEESVGGERR